MRDPQGCHVSGLFWRLTRRQQLGVCIRVPTRPAFHTLWSTTTLGGHAFPVDCRYHQFSLRTLLTQYMHNLNEIVSMYAHITPSEFTTFFSIILQLPYMLVNNTFSPLYLTSQTEIIISPLHTTFDIATKTDFNKIISYTEDQGRPISNRKPHSTLHCWLYTTAVWYRG